MIHASSIILVNEKKEVLFATRNPKKKDGHLLELPGGKVEDEESPLKAMIRETQEEVSVMIHPQDAQHLGQFYYDYGYCEVTLDVFVTQRWQGVPFGKEGQKLLWYPYNNIPSDKCLPLVYPVWEEFLKFFKKHLDSV